MLFDWIGQQLFQYVHQNYLVYGACWEDPRVDRTALNIGPTDQMLVITSAGCNVLDYLLEEPSHIDAVDLNYRQNALLDLKLAGIAELRWPEFFAMFGTGHEPQVKDRYHSRLRRHLQPTHQTFWDRHIGLFKGRRPFYHRTTSGWFASWFRFYVDRVVRLAGPMRDLLNATSLEKQRDIYDRKMRPKFWRPALGYPLRRDAALALSGIPPAQRRQIQRYHPNTLRYLQAQAEHIIYNLPLTENYFWRAYITGRYTTACCPRYLQAEHFERLKSLTHKVSMHTDSVLGFLKGSDERFSHFVLLDHMDWLAHHRLDELTAQWQAMVDRATPAAKFLWRSLGLRTDFVDRVRVEFAGAEAELSELLSYDHALADKLKKQERVNPYGNLSIATLHK